MSSLPQDIVTDVLCRLPVKSLLRFRCVSKLWRSQIDGLDFIKLQLNHSLKTNTNLSLVLCGHRDDLFSVDLDTVDEEAVKLNNPVEYKYQGDGTRVIGSCNGLVALYNFHLHDDRYDITLWNPYTKMYKKLPHPEIGNYWYTVFGFGYDPVTDDYKLVKLLQLYDDDDGDDNPSEVEFEVYSLKSNSWRRILGFPYYLCMQRVGHGILASNALHWVVTKTPHQNTRNLIVAFDLRTEEYFEVQEPDYVGRDVCKEVGVLGGLLCFYTAHVHVGVNVWNVWVMKEYGVKESWTKLFSVSMVEDFSFLSPLVYSKSGDKVLMGNDGQKFVWYDLRKKRVEKFRIHGAPQPFTACMCVASLVPLGGQAPMKKKKKKSPPTCQSLEFLGSMIEGQRLSFVASYGGGEQGNCSYEWFRVKCNGIKEKLSTDEFLDLTIEDVGRCIELVYTPMRNDGMNGSTRSIVSDVIVPADPVGLDLVIADCCEDKEVVPQKTYFGGQEGVGEYIWYRTKNKLQASALLDISDACEDVLICGKTFTYTPSLEDVGAYLALYWLPTRADGRCRNPLIAISNSPVTPALPVVSNVRAEELSSSIYFREGEYFGGYEGSSLFSWYRETNEGTIILINEANSRTYEVTDSDYNCRLLFGYTPVPSDSVVGELRLSEPTDIILPELLKVEMLALTGRAIEGDILTAVEVIPKTETQSRVWSKYKKDVRYQWHS